MEQSEEANENAVQASGLISRNVTIRGRRTSIRLEPEMWIALKEIARREGCTMHEIATLVSFRKRPITSLTAAIRVFLMLYYRAAATEEGHRAAGHGSFESMRLRARLGSEADIFLVKTKHRSGSDDERSLQAHG